MFNIRIRDIAQRREEIEQKRQTPLGYRAFYEHRPEGEQLPLITLDITTPVYRMANYRTRTRQLSYTHRHALQSDYFELGQEDLQAQKYQHEMLVELAKTGSGIQIKPIYETLTADHIQTEPLLITLDGVVVNGNRRLAAMRELYSEDPGQFASFQNIQAMVLPEVTAIDLRRIEVKLQMRPETRLPYDWTDQALAVRDLQQRDVEKLEIVSLMRLSRESEVDAIVERLNEAEIYITDFLNSHDEYDYVSDQEQQFIELQKGLRAKTSEPEKELARKMCHVVTLHSRDLGTRAYDCRIAYGPQTAEVAIKLAERLALDIPQVAAQPGENNEDELFGDIPEAGVNGQDFSELEGILSDRGRSGENAQLIKEVCDEVREAANEQGRGQRAQKRIEQALRTLGSVDLGPADRETYAAIEDGLQAIIEVAQRLIDDVNTRQAP